MSSEAELRQRVEGNAGDVAAWAGLAEIAMRRGDIDEALFALAAATRLAPRSAGLANNLALVLLEAGRPVEAQGAAERAIALEPRHVSAHMHLGRALGEQGKLDPSQAAFRSAVAMDPSFGPAHFGLATTLAHLGQWSAALAEFEEAIRLIPGAYEARIGKANCLLHAGRRREAVDALRAASGADPDREAELGSNALYVMQYGDEFSAAEVFEAHVDWARRHGASGAGAPLSRSSISRKIRIGYVSPAFGASAMSFALLPVLRHHDRERFEVLAYSNGAFRDETAQRIRDACDGWRETGMLDDAGLAQAFQADGIDILVDLAGHTPGNRLRAFALRPAPVQVSWLDYFNTTGLAAIGTLIADDTTLATPLGQSFVEKLASVGPCRYAYAAPEYAPPPTPRMQAGPIVFGSFARLAKVCPTTLDAWCAALRAVKDSRLLMKNDSLGDAQIRDAVKAWFGERGIDAGRIELRPLSGHEEMLAQYADIDIVLDTSPYNGGITTLEALWMGRPVVTLAGDTLVARQGASILAACGHREWVVPGVEEFARAAATLAGDREALREHHAVLRSEVARSPLCDGEGFTRRLEALFLRLFSPSP